MCVLYMALIEFGAVCQ